MEIKIKRLNANIEFPKIIKKGDWIDLRAAKNITMKAPQAKVLKRVTKNGKTEAYRDVEFDVKLIPLGIAMQLPKGYEAILMPRSGTFNEFNITLANSAGVIDNSYCGETDEWKFQAIAFKHTEIKEGDRICQFRVQLSQKATVWQKIKWLFNKKIKLIEVNTLNSICRGGFSSTGIK